MKNPRKNKESTPPALSKKRAGGKPLPKQVLALLEEQGLDTSGFRATAVGDMDADGAFCTLWAALDDSGLYLATGTQEVKRSRIKSKRLETKYTLSELKCVPRGDFDRLKTEQYFSRGRLIGEKNGEEFGLVYFSIGLLAEFDGFVREFNGESIPDVGHGEEHGAPPSEGTCPKCGAPLPPGRSVCPRCMKTAPLMKRLLSFFGGYKSKVAAIVCTMLAGTLVNLLVPQVSTTMLFNNVLNADNVTPTEQLVISLGWLVLAIFGMRLLSSLMTFLYQYVLASIMGWVIYDIKVKIFTAMQRLSVGFYTSKQTGSLMERVNRDADHIYWFFVDGLPYVIIHSITLVGVSTILFLTNWRMTLIVLGIVPVLVVLLVFGSKFFHTLHHRRWSANSDVTSVVTDNINGQRIIKAFSRETEELERFSRVSERLRDSEIKLSNTEATAFPIMLTLVYALTCVVLAVGGGMVASGDSGFALGDLLSYVIYLNMLQHPLEFLSWVSNWWARCADSTQRVFEIVDAKPDIIESENPVVLDEIKGEVVLRELEFEYEPAHPIIKKLNLNIPAGTMLGIVGKTGAGKTTIANLIARLYDAKAGCVEIDGIDVRSLPLDLLRKNIGLVSQDIFLFMGTIADNIRYADPNAPMERVIAATKAASAHEFIMKLPNGYETRVGAGGQELSGGERQRISIARTIIQNPKILILDEATAAMDTETERKIQESISRLKEGRTTVAIAHRLSTLRDADKLAVIDGGSVVEYGDFTELIKKKGEFFRQYKIQSEALKYVGVGED